MRLFCKFLLSLSWSTPFWETWRCGFLDCGCSGSVGTDWYYEEFGKSWFYGVLKLILFFWTTLLTFKVSFLLFYFLMLYLVSFTVLSFAFWSLPLSFSFIYFILYLLKLVPPTGYRFIWALFKTILFVETWLELRLILFFLLALETETFAFETFDFWVF